MKWTIGMPSYNNFTEVYFTVQALRAYHDLSDCEILVIDNYGDDKLKNFIEEYGGNTVRYVRYTNIRGVSAAKNKVFEHARGEYVLCIDSHILLMPGALDKTPPGDDMIQGPTLVNSMDKYKTEWVQKWGTRMWGVWADPVDTLPTEPHEIWAQGAGFFACRRDSWLGFHKGFRGFGGETGYIQEKYRQAGRKVWCYPNMVWLHFFHTQGRKITFPVRSIDRVRNYVLGLQELGLNTGEIREVFGEPLYTQALAEIETGRYNND